jgi:hypothetical protein
VIAACAVGLWTGGVARAAERAPVAVLWLGDAASLDEAKRVTTDLVAALAHAERARPLDSAEDRSALVEGGPASRAAALQARAESEFVQLKLADAARDYQAVEEILLTDVPIAVTQKRLAAVERNLLACYDQLGRADDAARAAERLTWTAGTHEDVRALLDRHLIDRSYQPAWPPVQVTSEPAGATVYRDLLPEGGTPIAVAGGDPAVDTLDVEMPGYRRAHQPLDHTAPAIKITLVKEDRLGALVDVLRAQAPDAPAPDVAALGRRVGAARVLVLMPDGAQQVMARWLDVRTLKWGAAPIRVDAAGAPAMDRLVAYVSPPPLHAPAAAVAAKPAEVHHKSKWGAWSKWYTWVAAGGVLALVGGLLIAEHVGSDSLKIDVSH